MAASAKLEGMTRAQELELRAWHRAWFDIGCATGPADRRRAEAAIVGMYQEIDEPPPVVVWAQSPATGVLAAHLLRTLRDKLKQEGKGLESLRDSLGDSLRDSLGDSLWASLRASLGASLGDSLGDSLRASLRDSLGDSLWASLGASLGDSLRDSLWASLWASLGASLGDSLRDSLGASLGASLRDSLGDSLGDSLRDSLPAAVNDLTWQAWWGQNEAYWVAYYLFARDVLGVQYDIKRTRQLGLWAEISQSCGWWWPYKGVCVVSERPTLVAWEPDRERPRLHSLTGPALAFGDGWQVHAIRGMRVPARIIEQPETITAQEVAGERNAELRRVMLERYGCARYLADIGARVIHEDADPMGRPRRLLRAELQGDEPVVMVEVTNSSPEPDSTFRKYHLRVPPTVATCHEAVAWTFNLPPDLYRPALES